MNRLQEVLEEKKLEQDRLMLKQMTHMMSHFNKMMLEMNQRMDKLTKVLESGFKPEISLGEINVPEPKITVNVPSIPEPRVSVTVPKPEITVKVDEVKMKAKPRVIDEELERDSYGAVKSITEFYEDGKKRKAVYKGDKTHYEYD